MGLGNLFGKDKDKKDDEKSEQQKIGETIKGLSDRIYELQKQLNQRNAEIDKLTMQLSEAQQQVDTARGAAGAEHLALSATQDALRDAQARMRELEAQIAQLAKEKAEAETKSAGAVIAEMAGGTAGMAVGATAWVQKAGGKGLRRRGAPGLNSEVHDSLAPGTQLTLLEGPVAADGYHWWRIRAADGREGWVAGEELVTTPE
ncbi:MAG: SH3 domain-containing protein [Chloroflexi bacterium]|nr:SH3 domain-containing protein [Chloroflexota bacterium]